MIRLVIILAFIAGTVSGTGFAQRAGFGLGAILGEPTGISLKQWIGGKTALDGAVAWSIGDIDEFNLHADYLVHYSNPSVESGEVLFYYGIGGRFRLENNDDSKLGGRVPVGINYIFAKLPLDIFLEIAPVLDVVPNTEFQLDGSIGIRYFFR